MYQFTDALLTGNATIDNEHRMLFQILSEAQEELSHGFCPKEALNRMEENLTSYVETHLAHEESYLESINDPELPIQKAEHNRFRARVAEIDKEIQGVQDAHDEMLSLVEFVARWLYQHIINTDCLMGKTPRITVENEDEMLVFSDRFKTGIDFIDDEHRELFRIAKRAFDQLHSNEPADPLERADAVMAIVDELGEYAQKHFAEEEEYMKSIHYAGLEGQMKAHRAFIDKFDDINADNTDMTPDEYLEDVIDYLVYWLTNHILKVDTLIPIKK